MLILTLRTDKPEAEIGLYQDASELTPLVWPAHRKLAETIHLKIKELLDGQGKQLHELEGIVIYKGPGSFTGLRIGFSVANALAASLNVSIITAGEETWQATGITRLRNGENEKIGLPEYGAPPHITQQKK